MAAGEDDAQAGQDPGRGQVSEEKARPQLNRTSSTTSSYREGRRTPIHYRHHEPAPKRLFRKIAGLIHQRDAGSHAGSKRGRSGSVSSHFRHVPPQVGSDEGSKSATPAEPEHLPVEDIRPNIKMRISTFNMANQLPAPQGDLSEFLGDLSTFPDEYMTRQRNRGKRSSSAASSFFARARGETGRPQSGSSHLSGLPPAQTLPKFPLTPEHPYHIIVVCGQECPTARTAGVFRGQSWTSMLENYLCGGTGAGESSDDEGSSEDEPAPDMPQSPTGGTPERGPMRDTASLARTASRSADDDPASASVVANTEDEQSVFASVEDFAEQTDASNADSTSFSSRTSRRGPYVLVEKERLMGIYCAVFVARCCEDLVEGVSKGRVTAGLIGGRVGNKGGVGISLHFASTRLLFVSAHLAAHASGLDIRKANAQKILDELDVDDFLEGMGPKQRRLVDRFDQTFFMGDLNFRLNISRLHADWLVQAKDFANALQFDQLRAVLAETDCALTGFGEAPIKFSPTYKYDLQKPPRKLGTRKRSMLLHRHHKSKTAPPATTSSPALSPHTESDAASVQLSASEGVTDYPADDTASVASTIDVDALDALAAEDEDVADAPVSPGTPDPVRAARVRFLTLVKRNSTLPALETARLRAQASNRQAKDRGAPIALTDLFAEDAAKVEPVPRPILRQSQSAVTTRTARPGILELGDDNAQRGSFDADEPVWDSSKKQRVQSWTDRILFYPNREVEEASKAAASPVPPPAPALVQPDHDAPVDLVPTRSRSLRTTSAERPRNARSRVRLHRQASAAESADTLASTSATLWQRVKSFPALTTFERRDSSESRPSSPVDADEEHSGASPRASPVPASTPTFLGPRRLPRRHFTLSGSPDSSPSQSPSPSPAVTTAESEPFAGEVQPEPPRPQESSRTHNMLGRSRTFGTALNRIHERHAEPNNQNSSLNTKFRSFLTSLPVALPFLAPVVRETSVPQPDHIDPVQRKLKGPLPGEVLPIKYTSVMNIERMRAVSDHRPVYLVCALGVEEW